MPRTRSELLEGRAQADRSLGERLAAAREQAGMTQLAAAKAIGLPQSAVAKLERGKRRLLFLEGLRLADLYGLECRDLDPSLGAATAGGGQSSSNAGPI